MASLKLLLGMIPSTSKIEQAEKTLNNEFEKLNVFTDSEVLARYIKLDGLVNSSEFTEKCKQLKSLNYKDSDEYQNEKEFLSLQKSHDIVQYFKTISGNSLKRFKEMEGSSKINDFEELEKFIDSPIFREKQKMRPIKFKDTDEFRKFDEYKALKKDPEVKAFLNPPRKKSQENAEIKKTKSILRYEELASYVKSPEFLAKQRMKPITFKDSDEYKKLLEFKRLKATLEIKEFYRFKNSKEYSNYLNIDGSARLKRFEELKEYVATPEFRQKKEYMLDKKRFEKSEMFKEQQEFKKLKKDSDIIWYYKVKDSDKFDILRSRKLTFSDEFEGSKLDETKWITNYFWGEKLLGDRYSVESDLQSYTDKDNFDISQQRSENQYKTQEGHRQSMVNRPWL